jgi:hypothetical protein
MAVADTTFIYQVVINIHKTVIPIQVLETVQKFNLKPGTKSCGSGSVYGVVYNKKKGEISYYYNGESIGTAYTGINKKVDLYPAIDFTTASSEVEFIKPKFKKSKKK